jgi:hypothetical protein
MNTSKRELNKQRKPPSRRSLAALQNRCEPPSALEALGRSDNPAQDLSSNPVEIVDPFQFRQIISFAVVNQVSIRELVLPLDVKRATPEFVFALDFDSDPPRHCYILSSRSGSNHPPAIRQQSYIRANLLVKLEG